MLERVTLGMIKLLTIAILGVILYRLLFPPQRIENRKDNNISDEDYVDYEEVDE